MSYHEPVMADECLEYLNVFKDGVYFDGTLGGGGHSELILRGGGRLIACDLDGDAIAYAGERFRSNAEFDGRYTLIRDNFKNVRRVLDAAGVTELDGAIIDLGISSHQIDEAERGFSYMRDGRLDMRMYGGGGITAYDIVNTFSQKKLSELSSTDGEERFANRIAGCIVREREKGAIETTLGLSAVIASAVPKQQSAGHPAKKTFQALRIAVNGELDGLDGAISDLTALLKKGARLTALTFHSLEDRIVKQAFRLLSTDCVCDKSLPVCVCKHKAEARLLTAKGIKPSQKEQASHPRSKSATLRVIEKL